LTKEYLLRRRHHGSNTLLALNRVSLSLRAGEALGVVGESGSGKSTLGRSIVGLEMPDSGSVTVGGTTIDRFAGHGLAHLRRHIQMVFQDPYSSLNPRKRVLDIIAAGPIATGIPRKEAHRRCLALLEDVGLGAAAATRFPHEFSGGQRQRIGIARALAMQPKVLIADEAVSALDVTVQEQILRLLRRLMDDRGISLVFITHDMRVAAEICDSIMVMKGGTVVDQGPPEIIFETSEVAYTRALVDAIPGISLFQ
jgi:peptide/nickel transport system ATP-binding protein